MAAISPLAGVETRSKYRRLLAQPSKGGVAGPDAPKIQALPKLG